MSFQVKYAACKKRWGFSIPGFQYYNVTDGSFMRRGKDFGKRMSAQEAIQGAYFYEISCLLPTIFGQITKSEYVIYFALRSLANTYFNPF